MKLAHVDIVNFRSIEREVLTFDPKCRVLVGINESGKSNILRALSMLSPDVSPSSEDIRQPLPTEDPVKTSYVRFVFDLSQKTQNDLNDAVAARLLTKHPSAELLVRGRETLTLAGFIRKHCQGLYIVNAMSQSKYPNAWKLPDGWKLHSRWKSMLKGDSPNQLQQYSNEDLPEEIDLSNYVLIDTATYTHIPQNVLTRGNVDALHALITTQIKSIVENNLPDCIIWTYTDEYLLPPQISLQSFATSPSVCIPLKHMFELAKVTDIRQAITSAQETQPQGLRNLLDRVSKTATRYVRTIWREYKDVDIVLEPNGPNIDPSIKDRHNRYEMSRRSDGFKRFVTFLLIISAKVKTGELGDALILIDEPDNGLHPSGARYLMNELLRISTNNYVVYSTHSIFMIDRGNIIRHLITKKTNEKTTLTSANESNVIDEEVLYKALGFSVFEILQRRNILFEGWRDKKLFETAISNPPPKYKNLRRAFTGVGVCHAKGVKDVRHIAPLLELANRDCFILSDDDNISRERQRQFQEERIHGIWKRYSELLPNIDAEVAEDFIMPQQFFAAIQSLQNEVPVIKGLVQVQDLEVNKKLAAVRYAFRAIPRGKQDEIVTRLKDILFEQLKPAHIEKRYYDLLAKLTNLDPKINVR